MDMTYYTAVIFIEIFAAVVMLFLMSGNLVLTKKYRRIFCLEYIILSCIALTEWLNTILNGTSEAYVEIHYFVKFVEFCLTPFLPLALLINLEICKKKIAAQILVYGNIVLQLISLPTHFIFYMNDSNEYVRGPGYVVFVAVYFTGAALLISEMARISHKYQSSGNIALWIGCLFAISGVGIQIIFPNARTSWLTVEMALSMSYIFIERLLLQNDTMTGMLNRFAYEKHIAEINYRTLVMVFDVDDFKSVNDSYGHSAGDMALSMIADAIKKNFGHEGKCYRIGGDEFCVILKKNSAISKGADEHKLDDLIDNFNKSITKLKRKDPRITGVSIGYAFTDETETPQLAFQIADQNMYKDKEKRRLAAERRG